MADSANNSEFVGVNPLVTVRHYDHDGKFVVRKDVFDDHYDGFGWYIAHTSTSPRRTEVA